MTLGNYAAHAAEAGARAYGNLPVELNVMQLLYYQADTNGGPLRATSQAGIMRYYHPFDFLGRLAVIGGFLPYGKATLSVPPLGLDQQLIGLADPTLILGMDFYGAPALSKKAFRDYKQNTILGGSVQVTAPLGRYDSARSLNLGGNRWVIKPELALSQALGSWVFDLFANYHYYTSNSAYLGSLKREQDGRWGIDTHVSYTIKRGMWLSLDYLRSWGGETRINGLPRGDKVRDARIGVTANMAFSAAYSFQLTYRKDIVTRSINESRSLTLKFQTLW